MPVRVSGAPRFINLKMMREAVYSHRAVGYLSEILKICGLLTGICSGNHYIVNLGHIIQYSSGEDPFSGQEISTCDHFKFKCWWAARARKGPP